MSDICRWSLCVDRAELDSPWCAQHRLLAVQHDTSHELEGHSRPIPGCPRCEDPEGWQPRSTNPANQPARRAQWTDQCPRRGPALTHTRTALDELGICVHCGQRVGS